MRTESSDVGASAVEGGVTLDSSWVTDSSGTVMVASRSDGEPQETRKRIRIADSGRRINNDSVLKPIPENCRARNRQTE